MTQALNRRYQKAIAATGHVRPGRYLMVGLARVPTTQSSSSPRKRATTANKIATAILISFLDMNVPPW